MIAATFRSWTGIPFLSPGPPGMVTVSGAVAAPGLVPYRQGESVELSPAGRRVRIRRRPGANGGHKRPYGGKISAAEASRGRCLTAKSCMCRGKRARQNNDKRICTCVQSLASAFGAGQTAQVHRRFNSDGDSGGRGGRLRPSQVVSGQDLDFVPVLAAERPQRPEVAAALGGPGHGRAANLLQRHEPQPQFSRRGLTRLGVEFVQVGQRPAIEPAQPPLDRVAARERGRWRLRRPFPSRRPWAPRRATRSAPWPSPWAPPRTGGGSRGRSRRRLPRVRCSSARRLVRVPVSQIRGARSKSVAIPRAALPCPWPERTSGGAPTG